MTALESTLRQICAALTDANVSFALVGGLAVSALTEPRFTRDADIVVSVRSEAEAEALIRDLRLRGYRIEALVEQEAVGRLATVRLVRSSEAADPVTDLLFASSGIEPEIVAKAEDIELMPGLRIRVASVAHLIALKVLARDDVNRPQDIGDLRALLRSATSSDLTGVRDALRLIAQRGYHRGRDLELELDRLLSQQRPSR